MARHNGCCGTEFDVIGILIRDLPDRKRCFADPKYLIFRVLDCGGTGGGMKYGFVRYKTQGLGFEPYSTSPRNRNPANRNHLDICLRGSQKNRNSLTSPGSPDSVFYLP